MAGKTRFVMDVRPRSVASQSPLLAERSWKTASISVSQPRFLSAQKMEWPLFNIAGLSGALAAAWAAVWIAAPVAALLVLASIAESAVGAPAPSAAFLLRRPFVVPGAGALVP